MKSRRLDVLTGLGALTVVCMVLACSSSNSGGGGGGSEDGGACPAIPTTCPSTPPSYKTDVQPLIQTYCYQCHSTDAGPGIDQGKYDWTQLSNLQANGTLISQEITATDNCNMPYVPDDPTSLPSAADRTTIAEWAGPCGAPDN
jgi:hypothetical protein